MTNPHGTPIWYEVMTPDPDAAKAFYDHVLGWTVQPKPPGGMDYRMIDAGDGLVGGMLALTAEMQAGGARPAWLVYIGVDDVDASVAAITSAGGTILMAPWDIPGAGRAALVADPHGASFYVMRGAVDAASTAFSVGAMGRCCWNELTTPDQGAANTFYATVFGWTYPDGMSMGDLGQYMFIDAAGTTIGATMPQPADAPPGWQFYFRAPDIDAAAARVTEAGGSVRAGPMDVPGGDRIIVASDPHGALFGIVAQV